MEQIISGHSAGAASRYCRRLDCSFSLLRNRKLRKTKQKKKQSPVRVIWTKSHAGKCFCLGEKKIAKKSTAATYSNELRQTTTAAHACLRCSYKDGRKRGREGGCAFALGFCEILLFSFFGVTPSERESRACALCFVHVALLSRGEVKRTRRCFDKKKPVAVGGSQRDGYHHKSKGW